MLSLRGLRHRSLLLQTVRNFFFSRDYLEVDTPVRLPVLIPEAAIVPISSEDYFLQTSPELCMKRLLARGAAQLFQICHCFRKGERGRLHQEEFTLLEWYHVGWSYMELMEECEAMLQHVAAHFSQSISLTSPWQRMTVDEAFRRFSGIGAQEAVDRDIFDEILVERVEPELGWTRPVFLYDYPIALTSLARPKPGNPELGERFELYIAGVELANGFSELTDPVVQRDRFIQEIAGMEGRQALPEKFLRSLADLPECAGIALGLDRLLMLLLREQNISAVLPVADSDL